MYSILVICLKDIRAQSYTMHHGFKTLLLFFTLLTLLGCSRLPLSSKKGKLYTVAFYNTEKFYDASNDPAKYDDAFTSDGTMKWTQERYQSKLKNIAAVISGIGGEGGPAILGLSEIENRKVLEDLVNTASLRKLGYNIIHQEMNDASGLDVALLYKPKIFKPTSTQYIKIDFREKGYTSRDILQVKGELRGELVTIYVNHWPPAARTRRGRPDDGRWRAAATTLRRELDKQQAADPDTRIIVMGDFDAEPRSSVMQQNLKATGRPNPAFNKELFNTHYMAYVNGLGSYYNRGDFEMLDQVMISKSLIDERGSLEYVRGSAKIYNPTSIKYTLGKYKGAPRSTFNGQLYLGGYSDHFPVFIQLRKAKR